jgi:hypothetical protein
LLEKRESNYAMWIKEEGWEMKRSDLYAGGSLKALKVYLLAGSSFMNCP